MVEANDTHDESAPHHVPEEHTAAILLDVDGRMHLRLHVDVYNALTDAATAIARGEDFFWSHGGEGEGDSDVALTLRDAFREVDDAARVVRALIDQRFPGQVEVTR